MAVHGLCHQSVFGLIPLIKLEILNHFAYSFDLVASDFHIIPSLNTYIGVKHFSTDKEEKQEVLNQQKEMTGDDRAS